MKTPALLRRWTACAVLLAAPLPGIHAQSFELLSAAGSVWRYLDDGSDQGSAWSLVGFDDTSWNSGPAQLGYGDGDEATVISFGPNPDDKHITTYFRRSFPVADPSLYTTVALRLQRDDGAAAYLNGVEIARSNLPAGTLTAETLASSTMNDAEESNYFWISVDPNLLVRGDNLLAIEVHQRSSTSSDLSFDAELRATDSALVSRGPYLQLATPNSQIIRWRTSESTEGRVRYGLSPDVLSLSADDPVTGRNHNVALSNLSPDTRYYYSIETFSDVLVGGDALHTFRTPPPPGSDSATRIWVLGDSGMANQDARAVRDAYHAYAGGEAPDLMLMLGDNAYPEGTIPQYQAAVFDTYPDLLRRTTLWSTRGNHEDSANVYYGLFDMPMAGEAGGLASGSEAYYSFDYANVHFLCLDSDATDTSIGGAMWTWAQADALDTLQDWVIAFWHHPPYTKGSHDSDTESKLVAMRQNFLPMLEAAGVDLVLCGHSHSYERSMLIEGHYGTSSTFDLPTMTVDSGDGNVEGDGAYNKALGRPGTVYAVAGSSGKLSDGPLNHPAMQISLLQLGSLVLDVEGGRLDGRFLRADGSVTDSFTLLNESYEGPYCVPAQHGQGCVVTVSASGTPSLTQPGSFVLTGHDVVSSQFGVLFYGLAPTNSGFNSGRLCVQPPLVRLSPVPAGGAPPCGGELSLDLTPHLQSGVDSNLTAGVTVYSQFWYRDPQGSVGSELSEAYQFVIRP